MAIHKHGCGVHWEADGQGHEQERLFLHDRRETPHLKSLLGPVLVHMISRNSSPPSRL